MAYNPIDQTTRTIMGNLGNFGKLVYSILCAMYNPVHSISKMVCYFGGILHCADGIGIAYVEF
jgi:hypothetical protein